MRIIPAPPPQGPGTRPSLHRRACPQSGLMWACSLTSYGLTAWLQRFGVGPDTVKELADLGG